MILSAAMLLRHGLGREDGGGGHRIGRGPRPRPAVCAPATSAGTRRPRRPPRRCSKELRSEPSASRPHLDERRVHPLRGRQGPRTDARPALRHRRLRGHPRLRDPERGPAVFRHADHIDRLFNSAGCTTWTSRITEEQLRAATLELIAATALKSCYIRPLVFRGTAPMGLYPLDCPVDVIDRGLGVGRLPRRRGQAARRARQGLLAGGASAPTR